MMQPGHSVTQLVLGGGEVPHPPPKPKVKCPACGRLVTVVADGTLRQHLDDERHGRPCPRAGLRP